MREWEGIRKPDEIGKTAKEDLVKKITALIRPQDDASRPKRMEQSVARKYKKEDEEVLLKMPAYDKSAEEVSVELKKPLHQTDEGYTVMKVRHISLDPLVGLDYEEVDEVVDKNGKPVVKRPNGRNPDFALFEFSRIGDEEALGSRTVTYERYNEIMNTLDKLTPDDEVN